MKKTQQSILSKALPYLPRIIGLITMLIGILYFNQVFMQSIVFILIGAILLFSPKRILNEGTDKFAESLKFGKSYLMALMYDILFLVSLITLSLVVNKIIGWSASQLVLDKSTVQGMQNSISSITGFFIQGPIALLAFVVLFILIFSISRMLIWNSFANKRIDWKKSIFFGAAWTIVWLIVFSLVVIARQEYVGYALLIALVLLMHFSTIPWLALLNGRKIGESFAECLRIGIGNIGSYLVPYSLIIVFYVIIMKVFGLIGGLFAPLTTLTAISYIIVPFFLTWMKSYIAMVVEPLLKK